MYKLNHYAAYIKLIKCCISITTGEGNSKKLRSSILVWEIMGRWAHRLWPRGNKSQTPLSNTHTIACKIQYIWGKPGKGHRGFSVHYFLQLHVTYNYLQTISLKNWALKIKQHGPLFVKNFSFAHTVLWASVLAAQDTSFIIHCVLNFLLFLDWNKSFKIIFLKKLNWEIKLALFLILTHLNLISASLKY